MISSKREAYRESLRQEILDAARPLFARDGYEATSIRKIAEKLGCSTGILYHYFEDKDEIMAELVRETFQKLLGKLRPLATDSSPVRDRLRRGLRAYISIHCPRRVQRMTGNNPNFARHSADVICRS